SLDDFSARCVHGDEGGSDGVSVRRRRQDDSRCCHRGSERCGIGSEWRCVVHGASRTVALLDALAALARSRPATSTTERSNRMNSGPFKELSLRDAQNFKELNLRDAQNFKELNLRDAQNIV